MCEDFTVYNLVTVPLLAVYLLIGNVMLLNLLIAIFTAVFDDVQENSIGTPAQYQKTQVDCPQ